MAMTDSLSDEESGTIMSRILGCAALAEDSLHLVFSQHCGETLYPCLRVTYHCEKTTLIFCERDDSVDDQRLLVRKFMHGRYEPY